MERRIIHFVNSIHRARIYNETQNKVPLKDRAGIGIALVLTDDEARMINNSYARIFGYSPAFLGYMDDKFEVIKTTEEDL